MIHTSSGRCGWADYNHWTGLSPRNTLAHPYTLLYTLTHLGTFLDTLIHPRDTPTYEHFRLLTAAISPSACSVSRSRDLTFNNNWYLSMFLTASVQYSDCTLPRGWHIYICGLLCCCECRELHLIN